MRTHGRFFLLAALIISGYALVWWLQNSLNEYLLSIINFVGIYIILASSLNLCNGFTGLFSLGHPAFMAVGGYVTAILTMPLMRKEMFLPDIPAWLANMELSFFFALLLGGLALSQRLRSERLSLRKPGQAFLSPVSIPIPNCPTAVRILSLSIP